MRKVKGVEREEEGREGDSGEFRTLDEKSSSFPTLALRRGAIGPPSFKIFLRGNFQHRKGEKGRRRKKA